jgi:hypothetical protein
VRFFLLFLFLLAACVSDPTTPEIALKDFIEARMGKIASREYIAKRVTGAMKLSLEGMSEADFTKFADLRYAKKESFKIISKSCQDKKCFLTYTISFSTKQDDKQIFTSEVKKIAELQWIEGKWLIADVSNLKTYHEALEPISPLE